MRPTKHATERWAERFPDRDLTLEYCSARKGIGKRLRRKIGAQCPRHYRYTKGKFAGRYYLLNRNDIVFVMAPPEIIITVFELIRS